MNAIVLNVWFQQALGFYSRLTRDLIARFDSVEDAYFCEDYSFLGESSEKVRKRLESKDVSSAFEVAKRCEAMGVRVTGIFDDDYPDRLRRISAPPAALYSIGDFSRISASPAVAIVGTRNMTDYGRETAENFAYTLSKSGLTVVSGLAKGVDTAAHRGAIRADGFTIGVLGTPIGDIYPKENEKAYRTLYERGLVVSELYPKSPRTRADFPQRNRIISALSDAVIIAEAGEGSGALITARHAIEQGRELFAVPGSIGAENAGTNSLIKQGVSVATDPLDVVSKLMLKYPEGIHTYTPSVTEKLHSWGNVITPKKTAPKKQAPKPTEPIQAEEKLSGTLSERIVAFLRGKNPQSADEIANGVSASISDVMSELTFMELDGLVTPSVGNRFSLCN